jgi:hypothetical protein
MFPQELCVYNLIACSSKNLCGIAEYDVGYVTVRSAERTKVFFGVAWPSMDGRGRYKKSITASYIFERPSTPS